MDYAQLLPSLFHMNAGYFLIHVAFQKITARIEGTKLASERLGVA